MASVTSKDIAVAAEAINRHRGLTPSARQVAIEILQGMNKASATTWRSVNGLAVRLALSPRTIGNALRLLRDLGLIQTRPRGGKGLLFRLTWSALRRIGAAIKREVGKRLGTRAKAQAIDLPPERQRDRQPASPVPTQVKIYRGSGWAGTPHPPSKSVVPDEVLNRKAHTRLWASIRGFGVELVGAVLSHEHADTIEAEAVKAERYCPGSGLGVLVERLRSNTLHLHGKAFTNAVVTT